MGVIKNESFSFCRFWSIVAQWVARDSSAYTRGPQGASASDNTHSYKSSDPSYRWDWLSSSTKSYDPSHSEIYNYRQYGLDGLTVNAAANPANYNKLHAWMHRISNAKISGLTDDEWKNYESCDGPACVQPTTTVATTTTTTEATTTANSTATADKSAECIEAETALAKEENGLAKLPLQIACQAACEGEDGATCGFLVNGISMILFALLAMLK